MSKFVKKIEEILNKYELSDLTRIFLNQAIRVYEYGEKIDYNVFKKYEEDFSDYSGKFYVWEGGDGSGKGSNIDLVSEYLSKNKNNFIVGREPGGLLACEEIRDAILNKEYGDKKPEVFTLMFNASRSEYVEKLVIPALKKGDNFFSDRFYYSTFVYQGYASKGFFKYFKYKKIKYLNKIASRGLIPNLTFIMDVPAKIGLRRANGLTSEFEKGDIFQQRKLKFHKKIRKGYLKLKKFYKNHNFVIIDTNKYDKKKCAKLVLESLIKE